MGQFILDVSTLGGGRYQQAFGDLAGQFKEVQFELNQPTANVDFEPHDLAIELDQAGIGHTLPPG
jgi:hypothetical protein